jgi:ribosome assembly protein YihI (activator of Der GTPase)
MESPNTVVKTSRSVIEKKLLTALEDENTVAVLLSKQDLKDLLEALDDCEYLQVNRQAPQEAYMNRIRVISAGLAQLHKEAFQTT